ncbi:hypothetical protein UlMin_041072 [Ulmus minor]
MTLLLNGAPVHNFSPKRGLRQGDPLSPYLFILAMEVLSRVINQKVEADLISGFRIGRHTPPIHHLFFTDDMFLLGKCTLNEAVHFKDCLDQFCSWSGQTFNALKSNIFFNNSANSRVAGRITGMMGFSKIAPNSVYLGLPLFRSGKIKDFDFLVEQLDSKLAGWKSRTLSKAKRVVLIQSIALVLPLYTMQTTKIPLLPKSCGGLGFRRMKDVNVAILSNWGWKILSGVSSLCLSILRARYLHHNCLFDTQAKAGDSPFWKSVIASVNLLKEGTLNFAQDNARLIAAMVLPVRPSPDCWVWLPASNGKFSTKSAYLTANKGRFSNGSNIPKESWLRV